MKTGLAPTIDNEMPFDRNRLLCDAATFVMGFRIFDNIAGHGWPTRIDL